jgi:tyrosine-protein phosphatase non-receptor type 14/21
VSLYFIYLFTRFVFDQNIVCRWEDIANVINHKRYFSIEGQHENFIQFQFNDVETAKYVWNMCVLQVNYYIFF